jgi:hypothetical protein
MSLKIPFVLALLLLMSCKTSTIADEQLVTQANTLIENHIWYYGPYSELYSLIGEKNQFKIYISSDRTQSRFITKNKVDLNNEKVYVAIDFAISGSKLGTDLPEIIVGDKEESVINK